MLRAVLIALICLPYTAAAALVGIPWAMATGSVALLYRLGHWGLRLALCWPGRASSWRAGSTWETDVTPLFISNHVSHLDAPVLFETLADELRALVKKEIFAWPFLGPVLRRAGFVAVDRRDRIAVRPGAVESGGVACGPATASSSSPKARARARVSSARSRRAASSSASRRGAASCPSSCTAGVELMPRRRITRHGPGDVRVRVLDPIEAAGYSYADRDRLTARGARPIARALADRGPASGRRAHAA